ncbi:MAG: outer membrane protein assembly factor BamE [Burkholderiales bacterium]|nr:outer membrane protein assembly factor BamE [Burkholderiales bacterium]
MKRQSAIFLLAIATATPLATFAAPAFKRMGDDQFKSIVVGETQQQVRDSLGAPSSTGLRGGETHYVYNYVDTWGMRSVFDVAFDSSGRVEKATELRVNY